MGNLSDESDRLNKDFLLQKFQDRLYKDFLMQNFQKGLLVLLLHIAFLSIFPMNIFLIKKIKISELLKCLIIKKTSQGW